MAGIHEETDRLCRPQRIGVFGHQGVGKTTFLSMLYREAVHGRLPGLRLAAADARTAEYLADKIVQLENGQVLPATLADTDLRWHLYHDHERIELLLKDYQGEQVALGRGGPGRDFFKDCDAVWLCLDLTTDSPAENLARQQQIEQLLEEYLASEPDRTLRRPLALVVMKSDRLGDAVADLDALTRQRCGMTRHALESHCPHFGLFAVSSRSGVTSKDKPPSPGGGLGGGVNMAPRGGVDPSPQPPPPAGEGEPEKSHASNLDAPLVWLADVLRTQDQARVEHLWARAGRRTRFLERAVACFAHRYPDAPATAEFRQRLQSMRRRQRRRRFLAGVSVLVAALVGLALYDYLGYREASAFEAAHAEQPGDALRTWQEYAAWHPTRHLLTATDAEQEHQAALLEDARRRDQAQRLEALRRSATDPDANPASMWERFQEFRAAYPEVDLAGDLERLRNTIKERREAQRAQEAERAFTDWTATAQRTNDLTAVIAQADRFLHDFADSPHVDEVRHGRAVCLHRLDERDIEPARTYSAQHPLNFQTRREQYQQYLDRHPAGGDFTAEAERALKEIAGAWDRYDFRAVRDYYVNHPGDAAELAVRCRRYLAVHSQGKFTSSAADLLRWTERVTVPGEYKIVLHEGQFDHNVARWFSRGPKLSVELEVNGVRHGPSTIVYNRYDPSWEFEFPRRVRWKLGDSVRIWVTEHSWSDRVVTEIASEAGDPLAIRLLGGEVSSGPNRLRFECDFAMPVLPQVD